MRATIADPGTTIILRDQLNRGNVQYHELAPVKDVKVQDHQFAVFTGMLFTDGAYLGAWIVTVMGDSGFYNQDNYPTPEDAVAQHIGRMVLEGKLTIVDNGDDGSDDTKPNDPPPGFGAL